MTSLSDPPSGLLYYNASLGQFTIAVPPWSSNSSSSNSSNDYVTIAPATMTYESSNASVVLANASNVVVECPQFVVDGAVSLSTALVINGSTFTDVSLNATSNVAYATSNSFAIDSNAVWAELTNLQSQLSNLSTTSSQSSKHATISLVGFPVTASNVPILLTPDNYDPTIAYYDNQPMPVGVAGFGNNSNCSNAYVQFTGYLDVKPVDTIPSQYSSNTNPPYQVTTTFQMLYATNVSGNEWTTLTTAAGSNAYVHLTSWNGTQGGVATATSDTFRFPPGLLGNSNYRVFLGATPTDTYTQSNGFYIANAFLSFF